MKQIIITYILSYLIVIIAGGIYNFLGYNNLTFFINNICTYILLIYYITTTIYLYKKNQIKEKNLSIKTCFPLISLGISIATIYNMIIFKIQPPIINNSISFPILIISSGIIGPIYEEVLFRYIFYNRLKKKYKVKKSILINSIVFALIHLQPIKIIYAFILGIILNTSYEKYQNIKAPILIHTAANTIVLFLTEYNIIVLLLAIINLIISININNNLSIQQEEKTKITSVY